MKTRHGLPGQEGFSLIEVLVVALILGVATTGLTLLLSRGQAAMVAEGDTRIALYLAQQKVERFRGLGSGSAKVGASGSYNYKEAAANGGCGDATANNEPCYNETIQAGAGLQTPVTTQVDAQTFTRLTCVRWVQDDDPEQPYEDPSLPPDSWACQGCTPGANCTKLTKRIKVAVIPTLLGGTDLTRTIDPNRVTLEFVLTETVKH